MHIRKTANVGMLLVALTGTVAFAAGVLTLAVSGSLMQSFVVILGVAVFFGSSLSLEMGIYFLLLLGFVEGIYKTLLPSFLTLALKDIVLAILLLRLVYTSLRSRNFNWLKQRLTVPAILFVGYASAMTAAPSTRSISIALAGLRSWIIWLPAYYPVYATFTKKEQMLRLLRLLAYISVPICLYGIFQNVVGYSHLGFSSAIISHTNWYQGRAVSVFNTPHVFGKFAGLITLTSIGLAFYARNHLERILMVLIAVLGAGAVVAAASRAPFLGLMVGAIVLLLVIRRKGVMLLVTGICALLTMMYVVPRAATGAERIAELTSQEIVADRVLMPLQRGFENGLRYPLGIGVASGAGLGRVVYDSGPVNVSGEFAYVENEFGRCFQELGIPGFFFWLWLLWLAMRQTLEAARAAPDFRDHAVLASLFAGMCLLAVQLLAGAALYDAIGIYFWLFSAFAARYKQQFSEQQAVEETRAEARA